MRLSAFSDRIPNRRSSFRRAGRRLAVEALEDRRVLAPIVDGAIATDEYEFREVVQNGVSFYFDADSNVQGGKRTTSTIAPQALWLMNAPFVIEQSRRAAARFLAQADAEDRVDRVYRVILGRPPHAAERELLDEFLADHDDLAGWSLVIQMLFQSVDFSLRSLAWASGSRRIHPGARHPLGGTLVYTERKAWSRGGRFPAFARRSAEMDTVAWVVLETVF